MVCGTCYVTVVQPEETYDTLRKDSIYHREHMPNLLNMIENEPIHEVSRVQLHRGEAHVVLILNIMIAYSKFIPPDRDGPIGCVGRVALAEIA